MMRYGAWVLGVALNVAMFAPTASAQLEIEPNNECLTASPVRSSFPIAGNLRGTATTTDVDFFRLPSVGQRLALVRTLVPPGLIIGGFSQDCLQQPLSPNGEIPDSVTFIAVALESDPQFRGTGAPNAPARSYRLMVPVASDSASFGSQFVQATQAPRQVTRVSARIRNAGTTTWNTEGGYALMNAQPGQTFGSAGVPLPAGASIPPGREVEFNFATTAPAAPGMYMFQMQMARNGRPISRASTVVLVAVDGAFADNALLTEQFVQTPQTRGVVSKASVAMRNEGTTTWTAAAGYALVNVSRSGGSAFFARLPIPAGVTIPPGERASFNFDVIAPVQPGTYEFQVQMAQGTRLFGVPGPVVQVTVQ
jgi:hypothetical protein